jgi:hypothetical protein
MSKTAQKIESLRQRIRDILSDYQFDQDIARYAEQLSLSIFSGKEMNPYLEFTKRLECYAFLIKFEIIKYSDIVKFERDCCDDGGKCLDWYADNFGVFVSDEINNAFHVQNSCFHEDGKTEEADLFIAKRMLSHLKRGEN